MSELLPNLETLKQNRKATWMREDVLVQVVVGHNTGIVELIFSNLAAAKKIFPQLTLELGMRGQIEEYGHALRFELNCDFGGN